MTSIEIRLRDCRGQGLSEYIIVVIGVALLVIVAVRLFGANLSCWFDRAAAEVTGRYSAACAPASSSSASSEESFAGSSAPAHHPTPISHPAPIAGDRTITPTITINRSTSSATSISIISSRSATTASRTTTTLQTTSTSSTKTTTTSATSTTTLRSCYKNVEIGYSGGCAWHWLSRTCTAVGPQWQYYTCAPYYTVIRPEQEWSYLEATCSPHHVMMPCHDAVTRAYSIAVPASNCETSPSWDPTCR